MLLETNVDDLDPRLWPDVLERLLAAGASDAWLTPILMKKGRPAHTLHALCPPPPSSAVRAEIFARTSTLGVRELTVGKTALDRGTGEVARARRADPHQAGPPARPASSTSAVEYEDVRAAADALGLPVKEVLRAATAAALREASAR